MNVEQRIAALEALLEKVRTNAAKPRPARAGLFASADAAPASVPGDDVVGAAVPAVDIEAKPPAVQEDAWPDVSPTALAEPLPGPAKEPPKAAASTGTTPKPAIASTPAKPAPTPTAAKPAPAPTPTAGKPAPAVTKPISPISPNLQNKPTVPATTAAKVGVSAPVATPNKPAATLPKLSNQPTTKIAAVKPPEELKATLQGVGDDPSQSTPPSDGRDSDVETAPLALSQEQIDMLLAEQAAADAAKQAAAQEAAKKAAPEKKAALPSAIAEATEEELEEPTKLYEPPASKPVPPSQKKPEPIALEPEKKPEPIALAPESKKPEPIALAPESKKPEALALEPEKKPEPEPISLDLVSEKHPVPEKKAPEIELAVESEKKPALPPEKPPVEKKPEPIAATTEPVKKAPPPIKKQPERPTAEADAPTKKPPVVTPKVEPKPPKQDTKQDTKKGGSLGWLLLVAAILIVGAGVFIAMQKGWIPGLGPKPEGTGTTVTTPPPEPQPSATAAPTAPPTDTATAAPTASATAAPTAAQSAEVAPTPAASASAAPPAEASAAPPAGARDPATLSPRHGLLLVNSNKPAQVYLTGKLAGNTGEQLEVECGAKFVRLADPASDPSKPPTWLTAGQSAPIPCKALTTITINVP